MQKKNNSFILALSGILLLASCAKEGPTGPTGPPGPSYTGSITGYVSLYDKYGSPVLTGLTSVKLTLGSSTVVLSSTAAISPNVAGNYLYSGLATGNYSITALDTPLYATTVVNDLNFVVGTLTQDIKLSAIPDSFLTTFSAKESIDSLHDSLTVHATIDTRARNCIVFVNSNSAVGNSTASYLLKYIVAIPANTTTTTILIPRQDLTNAGIASGKMVYYAAYSYVVGDASVYEDLTSGKNVYNAVNTYPLIDSALAP